MREIKFRAWDKVNGEMIPWNRLLNGHNLRNVFMRPEMCGLILMQNTGIKDKNGVEIYEGDIVSIENHPFEKTNDSDIGVKINGNYEVGWNEDDLTWCAGSLLLARVGVYVRIIGNIYENSDLSEVSE